MRSKRGAAGMMARRTDVGWGYLVRLTVACVFVAGGLADAGQPNEADEYQLKAAFLYKLSTYITWPADRLGEKDKEFRIAIVGKDPFGAQLDKFAEERKIHNRKVVVLRYAASADAKPAHVTFVAAEPAAGSEEKAADCLAALAKKNSGTFLMADTKGFAEKGALINFQLREQNVVFEINRKALAKAGFQVAPTVLKLGIIVPAE